MCTKFLNRYRPLLVLTALVASSVRAVDPPHLPAEYKERVELDQGSNTYFRRREILSAQDRRIVPVYHFDVPERQATKFASDYLDEETRKRVVIEKKNPQGEVEHFIRFFAVDDGTPTFAWIRFHYRLEQVYWGTRLQSHNTFFVWNPKDKSEKPVYLKLQKAIGSRTANNGPTAQMSIGRGDAVLRALAKNPSAEYAVLEELWGAQLGHNYAYSMRSVDPPGGLLKPGNRILPLHGFLGSYSHLDNLARAHSPPMTVEEWISQEYLPKLARVTAALNIKHGVYFAGHSQNLQIEVDPETGTVARFLFKDMNDVLFDPLAQISKGISPPYGTLASPSLINREYVDKPQAREAGYNIGLYTGQSVVFEENRKADKKHAAIFLKHYIAEAQRIVGHELHLGDEAQRALDSLERGGWVYTAHASVGRGRIRAAISTAIQGVYDAVTAARAPRWSEVMERYDQDFLRKAFFNRAQNDRVDFLWRESIRYFTASDPASSELYSHLGFAFDGKGILAFDLRSKKVIAYAFDVSDDTRAQIEQRRLASNPLAGWSGVRYEPVIPVTCPWYRLCAWHK